MREGGREGGREEERVKGEKVEGEIVGSGGV